MNIAIIAGGVAANVAVFDDYDTAQSFLSLGVYPGADDVRLIPDGYGIGDLYDAATDTWTLDPARVVEPEPGPEIDPEPTLDDYLLDLDYRMTVLEIMGGETV